MSDNRDIVGADFELLENWNITRKQNKFSRKLFEIRKLKEQ